MSLKRGRTTVAPAELLKSPHSRQYFQRLGEMDAIIACEVVQLQLPLR